MTRRSITHLVVIATACTAVGLTAQQFPFPGGPGGPGGRGPGGPGGPGFGARQDLAVVKQFDKDGNGWLDAAERGPAREYVTAQGGGMRGGGGRGFGRGGAMISGSPGPRVAPSDVKAVPASVPLYDPSTLRTIFFEFEHDDWEDELAIFKDTDVEVPARMTVDGRRYENVGVSFRGNSSFSMVPAGLKRSFNVTVDLAVKDQNLLGFRTLNLLNGVNDPTQMRGVLFQQIAGHYVPAARGNFVRVVVNGESWGVYSNIEQINRDFVADRFKGENGVRWKVPGSPGSRAGLEYTGDDPEAYKRLFEIKNKDNRRSWDALVTLAKVLNTTPPDRLEAALAPILDIDGALKFLALDNVLVNSDGYWTRGSDYYLYLDEAGRFHVLPGDTNETFSSSEGRGGGRRGGMGGFGGGGGGTTLDLLVGLQDPTKPLRSKLFAVPALRDRYLAYCREIAETWLDWKTLGPIATRYHVLIAPIAETDTRKHVSTEELTGSLERLRTFTDARRQYVLNYKVAE